MNKYYIEKLLDYAKSNKIYIDFKVVECVEVNIHCMVVIDRFTNDEHVFNIEKTDKEMIQLIATLEGIRNVTRC